MDRNKKIVRTSMIGIGVNLILVTFKAAVGFLAGSIAIILDAVNNLSDALSSVITIVGTKLAGRRPDKKHPYGYGRIEYITSVIISVIVLTAGVTSMKESIEKVFDPGQTNYTWVSALIIAVAVVVKIALGIYFKKVGKAVNSDSLSASGSDALFDAVLSFATLVAMIVNMIWGIAVEGILGALISIVIIKAGAEMMLGTLNSIIGKRADKELTVRLRELINSYPEVIGAYDITLHNYGPTNIIGSAHIEVDRDMTAREIHRLTRTISLGVYTKLGIVMTIGVYASDSGDGDSLKIRSALDSEISKRVEIIEMHGYYYDSELKQVTFDLIIDFKADAEKIRDSVIEAMKNRYPDHEFFVILDSDFSD